jgi:hypothetical protein
MIVVGLGDRLVGGGVEYGRTFGGERAGSCTLTPTMHAG